MNPFFGLSDSLAGVSDKPAKCPHCKTELTLRGGQCVNCLLSSALSSASANATAESFDVLLEAVRCHDLGWRLGNYEILEEIGRGGMGVIYRARQRHSRRIVAVKRVLSYHADSPETLERFRREAEAAASLDHPNILPIYEVSETEDGLPYFSMKFATGGSLQEVAHSLRGNVKQCVAILAKIARATAYAHAQGILHRDLKPGNILLDGRGEPLVSDFGLAKWLDTTTDLKRTLTVFGTPGYIAPEQAELSNTTPAADIYSLGAILFDLVSSRPPFVGEHALSVIRQASEKAAPKLRTIIPTADRDLETICARCLEREPGERYQSASALADDLERWLDGRPVSVRPITLPNRAWRWTRRNRMLVATATACLLFGATAIWFLRDSLARKAPFSPPDKTIAVVPFVNLSSIADQQYLSDGISEEILNILAKAPGLRVAGRTSSFASEMKPLDPRRIGSTLNVAHVVGGTVQRDRDRIRVTATLIDTPTGYTRWSDSYDREIHDTFALEDEIAHAIAGALQLQLGLSTPQAEQNAPAHELYLQGLYFSNKGSEADLRRALAFFEQAVAVAPNYGRAWTGIAKVWYFLADVYVTPQEAYAASRQAAYKAIALDDTDAEAHCYLSETKRVLDWDLSGAEAELSRAVQLEPSSAPAHLFLGLLPLFRGELQEGLRLIVEAKKLDPVSPITSYIATAAYLANDKVDDAIKEGQRTLQLDPNFFYLDSSLAAAYREKGQFDDAISLYEKAQEATHIPSSGLAIAYAKMGRQAEARQILARLIETRQKRYISAPLVAAIYVALGEKEQAFEWLERGAVEHSGVLQWIAFLPEFRALNTDPRFPRFLRRVGAAKEPIVAITEATLLRPPISGASEELQLRVGVKPRNGTQNGHVVRIVVSFYDRTADTRFAPTDAQVGYNWASATRDWTDPTPKFLLATYRRRLTQSRVTPDRRYGGFVVRSYFDGMLQDERAEPSDLLSLFPVDVTAANPPGSGQNP